MTMRFDVEALRAEPGQPRVVEGDVALGTLEWQGEALHAEGTVHVVARAIYQEGETLLWVSVRGRVRRACSRCLVKLVEEVERDAALEVTPQDMAGPYLELLPFIEAALRLGLSAKPLCTPDCRGICPSCGVDLNRGPHRPGCEAVRKELDPRLKALRDVLGELPPEAR